VSEETHDESFKPDLTQIANEEAAAQAQIAAAADEEKAIALAEALRVVREYKRKNKFEFFTPYEWQLQFYGAGKTAKQRFLMAANRVGKSYSACYEMACHLTGKYPDWWNGIRFTRPINAWALGVTGEQMRDVLQRELFGVLNGRIFDGAYILPNEVRSIVPAAGTPRLAKDVYVYHQSGGYSSLSFKSYSQGQAPLMGSSIDIALIDEEPTDPEIYPQVLTRTATGNDGRGGYVILTATPEHGMTELVSQFMENLKEGQYLQNVTWDDAPHLDEDTKRQLLAAIPEYQREMRSKGIPVLGEGMVYPVAEEAIKCDPFEIPNHFRVCAAIDFGISHPTAVAWCAYDPDRDIIYLYDCYKKAGEIPAVHSAMIRAKGAAVPLIYPHDGDNRDKGSGNTMAELYREAGLNVVARFSNPDGSNFVEPGIMDILERMRTGRFKVFADIKDFFDEFRRYHRKQGKIVKEHDDLLDAVRYAALSVQRYGVSKGELRLPEVYGKHILSLAPDYDF
jgi:phage terminase large subunit-like protein